MATRDHGFAEFNNGLPPPDQRSEAVAIDGGAQWWG
jgi:hypothetical protein